MPFRARAARSCRDAALELGDGVADALELSVAHAAYGRFLRRRGERRAAGDQLQLAHDELVLSVKTVNYHLGNVYTKLDVHSRAQLINHPSMRRR